MKKQNITTRDELEKAIVTRIWKDRGFLDQLKEDPIGTIKKEFGVDIPSYVNVRLVEEGEGELSIVIPVHPVNYIESELTDEMLSAAAGGVYTPHFDLLENTEYKGGGVPPGYHLVYGLDSDDVNKAWLRRSSTLEV